MAGSVSRERSSGETGEHRQLLRSAEITGRGQGKMRRILGACLIQKSEKPSRVDIKTFEFLYEDNFLILKIYCLQSSFGTEYHETIKVHNHNEIKYLEIINASGVAFKASSYEPEV